MVKIRFTFPARRLFAREIGERKGEYSPKTRLAQSLDHANRPNRALQTRKIVRQTTDFLSKMLFLTFAGLLLRLGLGLGIFRLLLFDLLDLLVHTVSHTDEHHSGLAAQELGVHCLRRVLKLV